MSKQQEMRKIIANSGIILVLILLFSCGITHRELRDSRNGRIGIRDTTSVKDTVEYELIVFDPGFDYWLASKSFYKSQYTNQHLQMLNQQYSLEWNRRYASGDRLIESYVDYNPMTKYDFEFNYKLYMYFRYFEESNRIELIPGPKLRF